MRDDHGLQDRFYMLADKWRKETAMMSSDRRKHPAYTRIIKMGPDVVPFIIKELRERPDHWFHALSEITGENPVSPQHRGYVHKMAKDWIDWYETYWARWYETLKKERELIQKMYVETKCYTTDH